MYAALLSAPDDFDGWRAAARALASRGVPAEQGAGRLEGGGAGDLFQGAAPPAAREPLPVPRAFLALAEAAVCHADPERFALLYALLLKVRRNARATDDQANPLVRRVEAMAKAVRRDIHKMHAFV